MTDSLILEMIRINGADTRRISHALKVYGIAACIAGREGLPEHTRRVVEAAAVLHDIAIRLCEEKYDSCAGPLQEKEGPNVARPILEQYTQDGEFIDRVCWLIAHHHTYAGMDDIDHRILIEADFIVNADEGEFSAAAFERAYALHFQTATGKEIADVMLRKKTGVDA
jgi:predicted metal-dependent HD superfamily phosphohydrolase